MWEKRDRAGRTEGKKREANQAKMMRRLKAATIICQKWGIKCSVCSKQTGLMSQWGADEWRVIRKAVSRRWADVRKDKLGTGEAWTNTKRETRLHKRLWENPHFLFIMVCNLKKNWFVNKHRIRKRKTVLTLATAAVTFSPVPLPKQGISCRQCRGINKYIINKLIRPCWLVGCRFAKAHPGTQHGETNYHPDNPQDLVSKCGEM